MIALNAVGETTLDTRLWVFVVDWLFTLFLGFCLLVVGFDVYVVVLIMLV